MTPPHGDARSSAVWRLTPTGPGWPELWRELPDPPASVTGRGDQACLQRPMLAIVGTRRPTPAGLVVARSLAAALVRSGWIIVSGLAHGIDAAAHEGALAAGGLTVAVMGTGLDRTYPEAHRGLRRRIERQGCVLTELPLGTRPLAEHFPRRNRLVAGLVRGVIVVEAPRRSGALLTARHALDLNREVMAVPGSVDRLQSQGCHDLLREGAALVAEPQHVHDVLPPPGPPAGLPSGPPLPRNGSPARWLWDRLDLAGVPMAALERRWHGSASAWNEALVALEMAGLIQRLPGGKLARKLWLA